MNAAKDLKNTAVNLQSATPNAAEMISDIKRDINHQYKNLKNQAQDISQTSADFINRHPVYSLLGAAAVGFMFGFIARKRNR